MGNKSKASPDIHGQGMCESSLWIGYVHGVKLEIDGFIEAPESVPITTEEDEQ